MDRLRKNVVVALVVGVAAVSAPAMPSWALTDTTDAGVSANLPLRSEISIIRDVNSVGRNGPIGLPILFDKYDDDPTAVGANDLNPNPLYMYAPYRSEDNKNWHLASIIANGSSMDLTADVVVDPDVGPGLFLSDILDVFCGGFFEPFLPPNEKGGASGDWELLSGFSRHFDEPITATVPFNYRLRLRGVVAGVHNGTIRYTLVSTI